MPTCPSCNSITFVANAANTFCTSTFDVTVDCAANPHYKNNWRIEYSSDNGVSDPWEPVTRTFSVGTFYPIFINSVNPSNLYISTHVSANNLDDISSETFSLYHNCDNPTYFQDNGDGYYRISFKFEYLNGDTCIQNSNSIQIDLNPTTAAGKIIDVAAVSGCVCNSTDPVHGASAELAINWSSTTSECSTQCVFEYNPTFILENNGDVNYHLPESHTDRTVKLFNVGAIGDSAPDGFAMTANKLIFKSETTNYITEISYQWPDMIEPSNPFDATWNSVTATTFKVGHYVYDLAIWQSSGYLEHPQSTSLNVQHRQRKIWSNSPNITPNYKLFDAATNADGYKSMGAIQRPAMLRLLIQNPNTGTTSASLYTQDNPNTLVPNCEDATFLANNPLGCSYANMYVCNPGEGNEIYSPLGFIVAADYNAGDSSGDIVGSVFLNLNPFCYSESFVLWGLAPSLDGGGYPNTTGNGSQGWGLESNQQRHGAAVAYARDTDTIVIGSPDHDVSSNLDRGKFEVFTLDSTSVGQMSIWTPKGLPVVGSNANGHSGGSVAISADGNIVAVGMGDGIGGGHKDTRVWEWNGAAWVQKGYDIASGTLTVGVESVALSDDGLTVIVGKPTENGGGFTRGKVYVHKWDGSAWVQKGSTISSTVNGEMLGGSVAISADGDFIAMTASAFGGTAYTTTLSWSGSAWTPYANITPPSNLNSMFLGPNNNAVLYNSVSLNKAGDRIAIGYANYNGGVANTTGRSGLVKVYKKDSGAWLQVGTDIEGADIGSGFFGTAVALDDSGYILNVSAPGESMYDGTNTWTGIGRVHQYIYNETAWIPKYGMDTNAPTQVQGWNAGIIGSTSNLNNTMSPLNSYHGSTPNALACRGDGQAIVIGSPLWGNINSPTTLYHDGAWNVISYCAKSPMCGNIVMDNANIIQHSDMAGGWLYPENNKYDVARSNPGNLPSLNSEVGITAGFNYKTLPATDIATANANNHFTAYSLDTADAVLNTGTANQPCSGLTDCPPFYHSSDSGARHTSEGLLTIINKIEFVSGIVGEITYTPTNATSVKLKNSTGLDNLSATTQEGWYHTKAKEISGEIYNTWNSANDQTPTNSINGTKQHWPGTAAGINFHTRLFDNSYDSNKYGALESTIFEVHFRSGNISSSTKTMRYAFDPFSLFADYGIIPYEVHEAGGVGLYTTDVSSVGRPAVFSCQDSTALNYFDDIYPPTPWTAYSGSSRKEFICAWCDSQSGNVESSDADDGLAGDVEASFELISTALTHPTYQNHGDGIITMTVNRMPLFSSLFPSPIPNYRYKAVLYRVDQPGDSWQDPMSYIVAGGIEDMLTTPTVTFSSTTYPAPLLVPEGNYSVKWSINVLDPGIYELEECWWEYPVTLTALNARPNPPIFTQIATNPNYYFFRITVTDTSRSIFSSGGYPGTTTPLHAPSSSSFCQGWEGSCIDYAGTLNGIPGENITLDDTGTLEPISGLPKYTTYEACTNAGFSWVGFDRVTNVEDVTPTPYGGSPMNGTFSMATPLLSATLGNSTEDNHQMWEAYYMPNSSPVWFNEPSGALWPSEQVNIKVTYQSGWTKTFTLTTPVLYNQSDNAGFNGWWKQQEVFPCMAEMWPANQYLYNEPQLGFFPMSQSSNNSVRSYFAWTNQLLVPQNALANSPLLGEKIQIYYHQIEEDTLVPAPTYPLPMYEGVTTPELAGFSNGDPNVFRVDPGTHQAVNFGLLQSAAEYGTSIYHANQVMGGFTGELVMRQGVVILKKAWADANTLLLPTSAGHRSTVGTSHALYDNLITSMLAGTGAAGNNVHTSPATAPNVGEAGTMTEAANTNIVYTDHIVYAKDCPVCLPPTTDRACRYSPLGSITNNFVDNLPVGVASVSTSNQAVNFEDNDPWPNTVSFDDGSCFFCELATGRLQSDGWDSTDNNPPNYEWYDTNDYPIGNSGGGPGATDYNTGTIVEGTGNILSNFNGVSLIGASTNLINQVDSTFSVGGVSYTFYKIEMPTVGSCATEGYADTSTSTAAITFLPTFWGDFLQAVSVNMNLLDLGVIVDLLHWNGASWDVIAHNTYTSATSPSVVGGVVSGHIDATVGATQPITFGHYKIRVRVYDTNQAWTGAEPLSWCYQEIPLNFRVLVCDDGAGNYITEDGLLVTDSNLIHIDNACITDACNCCPQVTASVLTGGTACAPTQTIIANYTCSLGQQVTQLDMVLWYIAPSGVTTQVGSFPTVTGSITAGTQAFGSIISGQAAIDGGQYYIVTTYTNTNGATCNDTTGPALTVSPLPTCECQDSTANNYLLVYPAGNADCNGVIGGSNYSCCLYDTYCGTPTITITEAACQIQITASTSCTLGTLPDQVTLQFFDVSTTGGVWDPNTQVSTFATGSYNPAATSPPYTLSIMESCALGLTGITLLGGAGTYVVKQIQTWANGYVLETISAPATITSTHYPIICGCTNPTASNYSASATCDDGSCLFPGCMDGGGTNYTSTLGFGSADDGITATNYDATATVDNGSCLYEPICEPFHVSSFWERPNCSTGWCDPEITFGWTACNLDILGNIIENPNNITILTGFSTDNGVTWTDSLWGTLYNSTSTQHFGQTSGLTVLQIFTQWASEGLIGTSDQFECIVRWRIRADYPTATTYYSEYKTFKIMNPHINAFGWTTSNGIPNAGDNDTPNLSPGQQVNCHAGGVHSLFNAVGATTPLTHSPGLGQDAIIIIAPCGCTDDGNNTLANTWTIPTVATYNSPYPGTAANNLMLNAATGVDDGSCQYAGCMDPLAFNYDANATADCLSLSPMPSPACDTPTSTCCCIYGGCTDPCATNYDPTATSDNGSCVLPNPVITGSWTTLPGCGSEYQLQIQNTPSAVSAPWGFTDVDVICTHNGVTQTYNANVSAAPGSNTLTLMGIIHCTNTQYFFTAGAGTYVFDLTLNYPGGSPLCDIVLQHTVVVNSTHIPICDCMSCPSCTNYNPLATCDDNSCIGCTDPLSGNYNPGAVVDDGSCLFYGCTDATAANFDFPADPTHIDDGSCLHWHIWKACSETDKTSFGGGPGPGAVSLANNQSAIALINPTETIGQTFKHQWWDGTAWIADYCWQYIGKATGNNPEHYPNPLNTTAAPSQWQAAAPTTLYGNCFPCASVFGCTDPLAINYDPTATVDDGSCVYPCCSAPVLAQASGHVDDCDVEYEMTINCNVLATDNADTITSVLEFWDGAVWQTANTDTHDPAGTDNITNHSVTYHYNCSADDFGGYGTGDYRVTSTITYSNGYTCTQVSNTETISMGIQGCTDPTATNYTSGATCQCTTCLFNYCCDTPVLTLDLSNGICNQSLELNVTCTPIANDGYTALWQSFATGSWVTIQTDTSAAATSSVTLTLANALLHTASGTSENYRVLFTSDYTAPTPDCQVVSNTLTVVAPILGCMDGGLTEYTVTGAPPNATGFGTPGDGIMASNYFAAAECDDGSCCLDGCTDPAADNYNAAATCDDGTCTYSCCGTGVLALDTITYGVCYEALNWTSDFTACPATPTSIQVDLYGPGMLLIDSQTYPAPVTGTVYHWSNTFLDAASGNTSGIFVLDVIYSFAAPTPNCAPLLQSQPVTFAVFGCTDPAASNYNPLATCDDGSCYYISACTDSTALNYNPFAVNDDGSCLYCGEGCTDASGSPSNYSASYICDCDYTWLGMGTCSVNTWFDEPSCTTNGGTWTNTYLANQQVSWNSCCIPCSYGCTDALYNNYNSLANCDCTETLGSEPCNATTAALTGANCCCTNCVYGCTDNGSFNDAWWGGVNGASYDYATATNYTTYNDMIALNPAGANNYNSLATCEDGSCTYNGCIDPTAINYNANLTGDCSGVISGTDYSCCLYPITGCTDVGTPALNVTPGATVDDGSCMYCDAVTGNYEDAALIDQPTWATTTSLSSPTSDDSTADGSLFTSFTLTASGLLLQALAEFQSGNNDWVIELYQVPTNGGASATGVLVATVAQASAATGTVWSHTFLNLPHGYYAIKLATINSAGNVEPTQCFIEFNDVVQATVCNDPLASNYPPSVAADLIFSDSSLCVYPGYCACTATTSVVAGPPCSNTATIYANIECVVGTDVSWNWQDSGGTILALGNTLGITSTQLISSLPITANGTYTFNWTETSTPFATCPLQTETITTAAITICGCTDPTMSNYSVSNTHDCNGDPLGTQNPGWNASPCCTMCVYGCIDATAINYNALATCDDGSCIYPGDGCCDPLASNFNSAATNCIPALCEYCND